MSKRDSKGPVHIAILGAGEWATQYHIPAMKFLEAKGELSITGIWNRTAKKAEKAANDFGIGRIYSEIEELVDDESVEGFAIIVNPSALMSIVKTLLVRNLPILTEKTPGANYEEAVELSRIVEVPNLVAYNRRYMPANQEYKKILDTMEDIYFCECHFYRNERTNRQFIIETGIHGVNCMEYLFGPIAKIENEKTKNRFNDTCTWIVNLVFASGLRGIMKFFPYTGACVERYEAHNNTTSAFLHSPQTYTSDYPGKIFVHGGGKVERVIDFDEADGYIINAGFVNEYREFMETIRNNRPTVSNFDNAANSMRVAEAMDAGLDL